MKKAMKLIVAAIGLALCVMTNAEAANSITYTVGGQQITLTDLGLLPGGPASSPVRPGPRWEREHRNDHRHGG